MSDLLNATVDVPMFCISGVYKAKVVRCYDGDTLFCVMMYNDVLSQFRVRLLGYNSCEMKPKKGTYKNEDEKNVIKQKALEAKEQLEKLVLNKIITLTVDKFDAFGRLLGYVKVNGLDVNQFMLDNGFGVPFKQENNKNDLQDSLPTDF